MYVRDWNEKYGTSYVPYGMEVIGLQLEFLQFEPGRECFWDWADEVIAVPIGTAVPNNEFVVEFNKDYKRTWYVSEDREGDLFTGEFIIPILDGIRAVIWVERLGAWVLPTQALIDDNEDAMVRYSTIRLNKES